MQSDQRKLSGMPPSKGFDENKGARDQQPQDPLLARGAGLAALAKAKMKASQYISTVY